MIITQYLTGSLSADILMTNAKQLMTLSFSQHAKATREPMRHHNFTALLILNYPSATACGWQSKPYGMSLFSFNCATVSQERGQDLVLQKWKPANSCQTDSAPCKSSQSHSSQTPTEACSCSAHFCSSFKRLVVWHTATQWVALKNSWLLSLFIFLSLGGISTSGPLGQRL